MTSDIKQRLLYLHAKTGNVYSKILAFTFIEPRKGFRPEIMATPPDCPYSNVHDALLDGWQVIQFPLHKADFDDVEIDMLGYEFILQKMEQVEDE
ncbi:hypothetical protein JYT61_00125 [bacterium AH-315-E10]|nr:hypothetical protein [bacterium AH-315-E10]